MFPSEFRQIRKHLIFGIPSRIITDDTLDVVCSLVELL